MPSRPMLTTPARSDQRPPRPARPIGTAIARAALICPAEVTSCAPVMARTADSASSTPAMISRTTGKERRVRPPLPPETLRAAGAGWKSP